MFGEHFQLDERTLGIVEQIGKHMPGGFFIYKAEQPEELLYVNHTVLDIFGCADIEEFKAHTGYTFKGMVHPEDYIRITGSINDQIESSDDNLDYVEYRIIRKDGSIRWVDDYGHFTHTEAYGGIYYVFISDITEKKENQEAERKRLVEEVENAAKLAQLMGSVASLLTNMPAMSFSKDADTGRYLACNQSFADYAHKKSPTEVIGLTDFEIFDSETAAHFTEDDKRALEMDEPYIFFEDVPDAKGVLRNLQTTKMKFTDAGGRLCTLGMCVDVTEMTRIKSAEAASKAREQELKEKIKLQEKLLEQSEDLREALKAAEEANSAKTNFLSNMSHEIRTPITAILGMNELIRRESTDKTILEYAGNIDKAGNSLLGIINDILDFSKIEAGKMEFVNVDYSVKELLYGAINLTKLRAEEKGILLKAEVDSKLPSVLNGDELRIKQILTNLLSNAVKYTEKGEVLLTCKLIHKQADSVDIYFSVKDTGIGIKEEEKEKLFSAFDRLDVKKTRSIEGTGLGLAITSQMLEMMDSGLNVESEYGRGSDFYFTISQRITDSTPVGDFDPTVQAESGEAKTENKGNNFTAPDAKILLVDDTPLNLKVLVGLLKHTRVQIQTAGSGKECIDSFGREAYDMVFLDYRMPQMNGIETLCSLKELYPEKTAETPIVCLTASAVMGDRERMLDAGFTDYLAKPVNIEKMESMMLKYIPADKVYMTEEDAFDVSEYGDEADKLDRALLDIEELDPRLGIEYCGDAEEYMEAVEIYSASVDKKAGEIEAAAKSMDFDTYTTMVHSLKSTSKAIGAAGLSELALTLEKAGRSGDTDMIREKTDELLLRYRELGKRLDSVL